MIPEWMASCSYFPWVMIIGCGLAAVIIFGYALWAAFKETKKTIEDDLYMRNRIGLSRHLKKKAVNSK